MLTPEQLQKLEAKGRELAELVLLELDSSKWPSMESKEGRGDRVWFKKNVAATLMLIDQVQRVLRGQPFDASPLSPAIGEEASAEERIMRVAEQRAEAMRGGKRDTPH